VRVSDCPTFSVDWGIEMETDNPAFALVAASNNDKTINADMTTVIVFFANRFSTVF